MKRDPGPDCDMVDHFCKIHQTVCPSCGREIYIKKGCSYCNDSVHREEQRLAKVAAKEAKENARFTEKNSMKNWEKKDEEDGKGKGGRGHGYTSIR